MQTEKLYEKFIETGKISTDTRQISKDSIFFALRGDKFNANEFATQALENGARYVVVDEPAHANDPRCILVNDVLAALQDLARYHRKQLTIPIIGLTGSNGKDNQQGIIECRAWKKVSCFCHQGQFE
jgi:UDP-N-acetylmuramoyl-tripeptide--D-alanyl-D-alanine ligase